MEKHLASRQSPSVRMKSTEGMSSKPSGRKGDEESVGLRDGSAVKCTSCFYRGPDSLLRNHTEAHNHLCFQFSGI